MEEVAFYKITFVDQRSVGNVMMGKIIGQILSKDTMDFVIHNSNATSQDLVDRGQGVIFNIQDSLPNLDGGGESGAHNTLNGSAILGGYSVSIALPVDISGVDGVRVFLFHFQDEFGIVSNGLFCQKVAYPLRGPVRMRNLQNGSFPKARDRRGLIEQAQVVHQLSNGQVVEEFQLFQGSQSCQFCFELLVNLMRKHLQVADLDQNFLDLFKISRVSNGPNINFFIVCTLGSEKKLVSKSFKEVVRDEFF